MEVRRLNEQEIAKAEAIIAPIAAEYVPNFERNFCEVANTGVYNLHTATGGGTMELAQRLIGALQAAGFVAEWLPGSIELRVPVAGLVPVRADSEEAMASPTLTIMATAENFDRAVEIAESALGGKWTWKETVGDSWEDGVARLVGSDGEIFWLGATISNFYIKGGSKANWQERGRALEEALQTIPPNVIRA